MNENFDFSDIIDSSMMNNIKSTSQRNYKDIDSPPEVRRENLPFA